MSRRISFVRLDAMITTRANSIFWKPLPRIAATTMIQIISVWLISPAIACGQAADVQIRLRSEFSTSEQSVRVGDVADVASRDRQLAQQLKSLDLLRLTDQQETTVDRELIELRVRLSGHAIGQLDVGGAKMVIINRQMAGETPDQLVARIIRASFADRFQLRESDLEVVLLTPFDETWRERTGGDFNWDVVLPETFSLGRRSVLVRCLTGPRLVATRQVSIDIRQRQQVLVTARDLPADHLITALDLIVEEKWSSTLDLAVKEAEILGRRTARRTSQGTSLTRSDLSQVQSKTSVLVRPREPVTVLARKGSLQVRLQAAEAVQDGSLGDRILIRNLESKRLITGVVVGPGQVEINLDPQPTIRVSNVNSESGSVRR